MNRRVVPWLLLSLTLVLSGCASMVSSMASRMADNLADTIANSQDVETVKQGIPAYLLLIDSFVRGNPDDPQLLMAAARLNGSFSALVEGPRVKLLTRHH